MPIPDFQSIMLPMLRAASGGKEYALRDMRQLLAEEFALSEEERTALLPSGRQSIFANRVAWSKVYLSQAGLLASPKRGFLKISPRGLEVLRQKPERIDIKFLDRFPEFMEFRTSAKKNHVETVVSTVSGQEPETPEEALEAAYQSLRTALATSVSSLTILQYDEHGQYGSSLARYRCGSWLQAIAEACLSVKRKNSKTSPDEFIPDLKRVAEVLGKSSVTQAEYQDHGRFGPGVFSRHFGGWLKALRTAGLEKTREYGVSDEEYFHGGRADADGVGPSQYSGIRGKSPC